MLMFRERSIRFRAACLLVLAAAAASGSVVIADDKNPRESFFGVSEKMDDAKLDRIRILLRSIDTECPEREQKCPTGTALFRELSGDLNESGLPILVVYLDESHDVRANRLLWKDRVTPFVYAVQNVWVYVFSDNPITLDAEMVNLWMVREGMLRGLRDVFVPSGRRAREEAEGRAVATRLEMTPMADDEGVERNMWLGRTRFYVDTRSAYEIALHPADERSDDAAAFEKATARFTNSAGRSVDGGIGLGITFVSSEEIAGSDLDSLQIDNGTFSAYWFLHVYVRRPILIKPIAEGRGSRYRTSYAISLGLNLDIFDVQEVIVGLNIGHLFGRHGIVVGANFMNPYKDMPEKELIKPFAAVAFNF